MMTFAIQYLLLQLYTLILVPLLVNSATIPPPTYFYDFTKLSKVNGVTYVLDQYSQDP